MSERGPIPWNAGPARGGGAGEPPIDPRRAPRTALTDRLPVQRDPSARPRQTADPIDPGQDRADPIDQDPWMGTAPTHRAPVGMGIPGVLETIRIVLCLIRGATGIGPGMAIAIPTSSLATPRSCRRRGAGPAEARGTAWMSVPLIASERPIANSRRNGADISSGAGISFSAFRRTSALTTHVRSSFTVSPGPGKTALMAKAVEQQKTEFRNQKSEVVVRFIGATPGSSDLRTLLSDPCRELGVTEIPQDMNELVRTFRAQLSTEQTGGKEEGAKPQPANQCQVVLFLDALDQLNPTDNARMLYWLPRELKPNVKFIVSVLEAEQVPKSDQAKLTSGIQRSAMLDDPFDLAHRIWPQSLLEVGALDESSGAELLNSWLTEAGRTLQDIQRREVLIRFAHCPLPLYLKLATKEAQRWKSWEGVPVPLGESVEALLEQLLVRLERPEHHGQTLVGRSLGDSQPVRTDSRKTNCSTCCRRQGRGAEFAAFPRISPRGSASRHRLVSSVCGHQPYMTRRRADGTVVMDFYHRQVGEAVRKRYLQSERTVPRPICILRSTSTSWTTGPNRSKPSVPAPSACLPRPARPTCARSSSYRTTGLRGGKLAGKDDPKSPYWDAVADLLTDWQFLEAKAEADPNFQEQESVETPVPSSASGGKTNE